jgi:hypothetical protein
MPLARAASAGGCTKRGSLLRLLESRKFVAATAPEYYVIYINLPCNDSVRRARGVTIRPGSYRVDWKVPIGVATEHESSRPRRHRAEDELFT